MRKVVAATLIALALASLSVDEKSGLSLVREASASVSVLMSVDELVDVSSDVVIATAVERKSQWEDLPSGKRIVTYTRLVVDESVSGTGRAEIWVRTLGGKVGKIGQLVSGEAEIALDSRALLFLAQVDDGSGRDVTIVAGMAQGHFPIDEAGNEPRLKASPDAGLLLPRRGPAISAQEVLVGRKLTEARGVVRASMGRKIENGQKRKN